MDSGEISSVSIEKTNDDISDLVADNVNIDEVDAKSVDQVSHVPNVNTPQIVVQIRSKELWLSGVDSIYNRSFEAVSKICALYHLNIKEVNENRTDFCWHTNYLSNPEKYFKIDNFAKMQVRITDRACAE